MSYATSIGGATAQNLVFDRVQQQSVVVGNGGTEAVPRISADGRFVAHTQVGDVASGDTNGKFDVYLVDRQLNTTAIVSTTPAGAQGTGDSEVEGLSADGRFVLFVSWSPNFPGTRPASPITWDLFIKDVQTGELTQVNVNSSGQRFDVTMGFGFGGDEPAISSTGRFVTFASAASHLGAGDSNGLLDTFLYDHTTRAIVRVNMPREGGEARGGRSTSGIPSADGRYVVFASAAHNLVPGDTNFDSDVFVRDLQGTPPCAVSFSPSGLAVVSNSGGSGTVAVSAAATCQWTASANATWIHITSAPIGVGNGTISYSYDPYSSPSTIRSGAIVANTATHGLRQLPATTQPPFGPWETPATPPGATFSGAVAFTGWALDDVQVARIRLSRDPVAGEGSAQVFVGDAGQVAGARPDVASANPSYPYNTAAGWGLLVLTNMLPNQGNGAFTFHVYYDDVDGHSVLAGSRTLTCTNATATVPFGTLDTPAQGVTVSGTIVNFGWALTPQPASIPTDGSTINVFVDGVNLGHPSYNHARSDIAALFPGYQNSNGPVGFFTIDTTVYADGVHTIAWTVTDNLGAVSGIGSRYFTIRNSSAPAPTTFARSSARTPSAPLWPARSTQAIIRARGDVTDWIAPATDGVYEVRVRDLDRIELRLDPWLGPASCDRFASAALPAGASLDSRSGVLVWQPAAGIGGTHQIQIVRTSCAGGAEQVTVRVVFE